MPRKARIDIAGCLYHVIARGIERRKIFLDKEDYADFLVRLSSTLNKTCSKCLAWCLMPNHFHLLILRCERPLAEFMRRLMTGYAVGFNARHKRCGHLFQNRYKAVLCEKDEYLLELSAYIHLNPLRADLVKDMDGLVKYRWSSYREMLKQETGGIADRDYILRHFGEKGTEAVKKFQAFVAERAGKYRRGEYSGGGLIKSMGGMANVLAMRRDGEWEICDDRVLGCGDFVEKILKEAEGNPERKDKIEEIMKEVENQTGLKAEEILSRSQRRKITAARAVYCYLAKERGGINGAILMKQLGMSSGGITRLVYKGKMLHGERESVIL
ncbi:MAG: transposase [bacterium]